MITDDHLLNSFRQISQKDRKIIIKILQMIKNEFSIAISRDGLLIQYFEQGHVTGYPLDDFHPGRSIIDIVAERHRPIFQTGLIQDRSYLAPGLDGQQLLITPYTLENSDRLTVVLPVPEK